MISFHFFTIGKGATERTITAGSLVSTPIESLIKHGVEGMYVYVLCAVGVSFSALKLIIILYLLLKGF